MLAHLKRIRGCPLEVWEMLAHLEIGISEMMDSPPPGLKLFVGIKVKKMQSVNDCLQQKAMTRGPLSWIFISNQLKNGGV